MTPFFFHLISHGCSQCDVPPHDINSRTLLSIQPLTQETMAENIGLTAAKDFEACSLLKDVRASTQFLDLQGRLRVKFSHSRTYMYVNCRLISYVLSQLSCFHTNVSCTTC